MKKEKRSESRIKTSKGKEDEKEELEEGGG